MRWSLSDFLLLLAPALRADHPLSTDREGRPLTYRPSLVADALRRTGAKE